MCTFLLNKLHRAAVEAVEYKAETDEDRRAALKALDAAFEAAHDGRAKDIVFKLETTKCPSTP